MQQCREAALLVWSAPVDDQGPQCRVRVLTVELAKAKVPYYRYRNLAGGTEEELAEALISAAAMASLNHGSMPAGVVAMCWG